MRKKQRRRGMRLKDTKHVFDPKCGNVSENFTINEDNKKRKNFNKIRCCRGNEGGKGR